MRRNADEFSFLSRGLFGGIFLCDDFPHLAFRLDHLCKGLS